MDLAASVGDTWQMAQALLVGGSVEVARGCYGRAHELISEGVEVGRETGSPFLAAAGTCLAALDVAEGAAERAIARYQDEERARRGTSLWMWWLTPRPAGLAEAYLALGNVAGARECVEPSLMAASSAGRPMDMAHLRLARGRLHRAEGTTAKAEADAHAALATFASADSIADALAALDVVAGCAADQESSREAARLLGATRAIRERIGCVLPVFDKHEHDATLALLRAQLDAAGLDVALREGAELSLKEAIAYAGRGRGQRKRPSVGWESLTPTELDVVRLVATGASNRELADRLFISLNTVKIHLSHVFAKLGVSSRSELAALVARRGI
jgi:DNA-binding CsgD family transcriptional regulator